MNKKFLLATFIIFFSALNIFPQRNLSPSQTNYSQPKDYKWTEREVLIYRPLNSGILNQVRCWMKIYDEEGNDVTFTKTFANYAWRYDEKLLYRYQKTYYLTGEMIMHLWLHEGKYKITFYTPPEEQKIYFYNSDANFKISDETWISNEYILDTANMPHAIFVSPTANENGFYNGGWYIDYKAPKFYKYTKPKQNVK